MFGRKKKYTVEELRKELKEDSYALAYGAGIPEALFEVEDVNRASDEEIIRMAKKRGLI